MAAKLGFELVKQAMLKLLMKKGDDGIVLTLPKNEIVDLNARITMDRLIKAGIDPESLTSPDQVLNVLENINNQTINNARVIPGTSAEGKAITEKLFGKKGEVVDMTGKKIDTSQGIMGGKSVKELMESGQVQKGTDDIKISDKITEREMFKNSNLNKKDSVTETISYIKTLEPIDAMKEANSVIGRKGKYKNLTPEESKKILQDTEDHIFERDIPDEDFAKGGRAGYQAGNQVTPQVDARMNLDYDTLVNQNTAQRSFMKNWRDHATASQAMKGKAGLESIPNYGMQSGYDFQKKFNYNPKTAAVLGAGYQLATEGLGMFNPKNPNFLNPIKAFKTAQSDATKNIEGILAAESNNLTAEQQADRNKYLERVGQPKDPVVDQDRISEIVEQQKAAGVPDEGLITNFNRPTMADVAGPTTMLSATSSPDSEFEDVMRRITGDSEGYAAYAGIIPGFKARKRSDGKFEYKALDGQIYGPDTYASIAAGMYPNIYDPNSQTLAQGGRAGYYTGGMVDVEPNLSDIGHGSDALMARTRLVAPDSQATTSTGLNYLLAEDNDNIRVPFSKGKLADAARRKFMKAAGAAGAGIAALKTGLLGFGEKAAPVAKEVIETVSKTAQSVPPYFLNLVNKIKKMGESTLATKDKANAYKYKDYVMEEDFAGNIEIIKKGDDVAGNKTEDVYMSYKVDEVPVKKGGSAKVEDYEEFTARPDGEGKMKDVEPGVPDEVVQEGTMFEDDYTDFGKAEGGRIGFSKGKLATNAVKFLEKIFGKESMAEMPKRDPEMYQGMLEVVDMFRNRDKEGLKKYLQKFLPHMDDAQVEDLIVGDAEDLAGLQKFGLGNLQGQLIRLGSGRDYAGKIEAIKKLEDAQKLDTLDVTEEMIRKPNAFGGIQTMLGE